MAAMSWTGGGDTLRRGDGLRPLGWWMDALVRKYLQAVEILLVKLCIEEGVRPSSAEVVASLAVWGALPEFVPEVLADLRLGDRSFISRLTRPIFPPGLWEIAEALESTLPPTQQGAVRRRLREDLTALCIGSSAEAPADPAEAVRYFVARSALLPPLRVLPIPGRWVGMGGDAGDFETRLEQHSSEPTPDIGSARPPVTVLSYCVQAVRDNNLVFCAEVECFAASGASAGPVSQHDALEAARAESPECAVGMIERFYRSGGSLREGEGLMRITSLWLAPALRGKRLALPLLAKSLLTQTVADEKWFKKQAWTVILDLDAALRWLALPIGYALPGSPPSQPKRAALEKLIVGPLADAADAMRPLKVRALLDWSRETGADAGVGQ